MRKRKWSRDPIWRLIPIERWGKIEYCRFSGCDWITITSTVVEDYDRACLEIFVEDTLILEGDVIPGTDIHYHSRVDLWLP